MQQAAFSSSLHIQSRPHYGLHLSARRRRAPTLSRRPQPRFTALISVDKSHYNSIPSVGESIYTNSDGLTFRERALSLVAEGSVPSDVVETLAGWYGSYRNAVDDNRTISDDPTVFTEKMFSTLLELSRRAIVDPVDFKPYHERIRQPFDYYKFGYDFAGVLLNKMDSLVLGQNNLRKAEAYARQGHNVIFLSNHQSEGDPYAIDFLMDWVGSCERSFCESIIFMAGDRVRNDPVVSPFSAGRNLLTVYSKKHINDVPEEREQKLLHNRRTISATQKLFKQGGKAVWFAPSGGRDRRSKETGRVEIAKFDEGAVDMMRFTALKSGTPCHFFPMSLWTYEMLPPPPSVSGSEIGEERTVKHTPMHMFVGDEIEWSESVPADVTDKLGIRKARCSYIERIVKDGYVQIGGYDL